MTPKTKELFEALNLLRYASDHITEDISKEEIQDAYYKIFDLLSQLKWVEEQNEYAEQLKKEQDARFNKVHKVVTKKFNGKGAVEIAKEITDRMSQLGITNQYVISEMSTGQIGIINSKSDPNNKEILRVYDDLYDFEININDDLKTNFKREKLFSNIKTLKKGDHE